MEKARNEIQKVSVKNDRCEVTFSEHFKDQNLKNEVNKKCDQIVHQDLISAMSFLRPFLVTITEQPEASGFNPSNIDSTSENHDLETDLQKYIVTGYSHGGSDESAGVTLIGQKILRSGQVLNLIAPFTKFSDNNGDGYAYGEELREAIDRCDSEVMEYLFAEKWGVKQQTLDFEYDTPAEDVTVDVKPDKKSRKKAAKKQEPVVFDQTA